MAMSTHALTVNLPHQIGIERRDLKTIDLQQYHYEFQRRLRARN